MVDLCLLNCKLPPENVECSIAIENGKIISIKKIAPKCDETIDLDGKVVLPGLIDAHVHMRDPGLTQKEDWKTGSMAATAGGFTTVLDMPNTIPETNTPRAFREKLEIARKKSVVDFGLHAGVKDPGEIQAISKLKPASFKVFMDTAGNGSLVEVFREVSRVSSSLHEDLSEPMTREKPLISLHCEDKDITAHCTESMKLKGEKPEIYADARPPIAEVVAVSSALAMAEYFNSPIHVCHVSTRKALELINRAKNQGYRVTAEATPHHLLLDSGYIKKFGNLAKTNPPLRNRQNNISMDDLSSIDIIGTDHAPHTIPEKEQDVWNAPSGIPGLETVLPLFLTEINRDKFSFSQLERLFCQNPAKIFNIKNKGFIKEGMDADLVVVDMKKEGVVDPDKFHSKAHYSPFEGFKVRGMPVMTMVRGSVVMDEGEVFNNKGSFIYG